MADLVFQRHRLLTDRDTATASANYLECHNIQAKITDLGAREKRIQASIQSFKHVDTLGYVNEVEEEDEPMMSEEIPEIPEEVGRSEPDDLPLALSPPRNDPLLDPVGEESFQIGTAGSVLKGLVLLNRFLSWTHKINPFIRSLYENHIIQCLEVKCC